MYSLLCLLHYNFTRQWSRTSEQSAVCHINFSFKVVKRSRFTFRRSASLNHWHYLLQSQCVFALLSLAVTDCILSETEKTVLNLFTWTTSDSGVCTTSLLLKTQAEFFPGLYSGRKSSICNWNNFFCLWDSFLHHWHKRFTACFGKEGAGGLCMHKHWKLLIFLNIFAGIHLLLGFLQHYLQSLMISVTAKMLLRDLT